MSVGQQPSVASLNNLLTQYAVALRDACSNIAELNTQINGQATGLATLEGIGFNATDAQNFLNMLADMQNVAGCYYGTVQQGGSGGTGAILFNFHQALSQITIGQ